MISFREVQPQDAEMILQWRTNPRVAAQMNTEVKADLEPHRKWLMGCYERPNYYHWLIESQRTAVGLISLSGLNTAVGYTSWGFYIGDDHALGLGAFVPPYFYNFVFETFGLAEVRAEVLTTNGSVVKLHQLHGYVRHPERDQTIIKGGKPETLLAMALAADTWRRGRFTHMRADFPTSLWRAAPVWG